MLQVEADAGHDALLERILIDRDAARTEMAGRIDMRAAMGGHRDENRRQTPPIVRVRQRVLVVLPHAVDDGRVAGIARRAMIELAAEVDDFHEACLLGWELRR